MAKHIVSFPAHKRVKEPVRVAFVTESGKKVSFPAHKKIKEPVQVKFIAKDHKK